MELAWRSSWRFEPLLHFAPLDAACMYSKVFFFHLPVVSWALTTSTVRNQQLSSFVCSHMQHHVGGCDSRLHLPVLWPCRFLTSTLGSNDFTTRDWKTLRLMLSKTVVSLCEHSSSSCSTGQHSSEEEVKGCRSRRSLPVSLRHPHTTAARLVLWHFSLPVTGGQREVSVRILLKSFGLLGRSYSSTETWE